MSVVIVNPDETALAEQAYHLFKAGYSTITASTFSEVRSLLSVYQPKALVSAVRLGGYNGLHLAIVARMKHGPVPTILLGEADHALEQEAVRAGVHYMRLPVSLSELVDAIRERVQQTRSPRRHVRVQPAQSIPVVAGGLAGRIVDLSELGVGVSFPPEDAAGMVDDVDVSITVCGMALSGRRIWHQAAVAELRCGIALMLATSEDIFRWRMVVDQVGTARGTLST